MRNSSPASGGMSRFTKMKRVAGFVIGLTLAAASVCAQGVRVDLLGDPGLEFQRSWALRTDGKWSMFQSASTRKAVEDSARWMLVLPHTRVVNNSDLPYSLNDGALWAGRGPNTDVVAGI